MTTLPIKQYIKRHLIQSSVAEIEQSVVEFKTYVCLVELENGDQAEIEETTTKLSTEQEATIFSQSIVHPLKEKPVSYLKDQIPMAKEWELEGLDYGLEDDDL